ncbi:pentapeptide repeat-containing protein [Kamptonema formosum]|uniref:pentapeptide repeat-containing protein n=1 Tax=Kamptonema formosum TaxID=331992 RepID=UPI0003608132|nr:pentapeptide repeat-containing protein [Oscillatoria sp. PCC 10802]
MADKMSAGELQKHYAAGRRNFPNIELSGADLKRANLQGVNLQGANLHWVNLQGANLEEASLTGADFHKTTLLDAKLQKANLQKAHLKGVNLQWANLQEACLQEAVLPKTDLGNANLRGANLRWASLQGANLQKASLAGADLRMAGLAQANLAEADLQKAKLQNASLQQASLTGANLQQAFLIGAELQQASLVSANLQDAFLQQANLQGADLRKANLASANLQGANLQGAALPSLKNMSGANLFEANLEGVQLPEGENLHEVLLPSGLIPDSRDTAPMQSLAAPPTSGDIIPKELQTVNNPTGTSPGTLASPTLGTYTRSLLGERAGGLGLVQDINLEGSQSDRQPAAEQEQLALAQQRADGEGDSESAAVAAERSAIDIARRRGKSAFRQKLLEAYRCRCAITGCNAEAALEAAPILRAGTPESSSACNGLLLRADIHTLFDLNLIAIEPDTLTVRLAPSLSNTTYSALSGQPLNLPADEAARPSREALQQRWDQCRWAAGQR